MTIDSMPEYGSTLTEHRIPRARGNLYAREYPGEGPTFVMMHGFPDNLHIYDFLIPHLTEAGRHVVAFDFLGFGASDKPVGEKYGFRQQVEDLLSVADALGLDRIVPVAHDSSGPAAINFALDYATRVHSVCILNSLYAEAPTLRYPEFIELFATKNLRPLTQAMLRSPAQFAWILNFQRDSFQSNLPEHQKERYATFLGPVIDANFRDTPGSGPAFAQMTSELFEEASKNVLRLPELAALDIPVQLIWGKTDPYLNTGVADSLKLHMKRASLTLLDAGHWVQIDAPAEVARLMLAAD